MTLSLFLHANGRAPHVRLSMDDRYLFLRQLHVLQKSGVPLLSSLRALEAQVPAGTLKQLLGQFSADLLKGQTLSQVFARHPRSFDAMFLGMIRVGEAGGLLEEVLKKLAELCAWELELRAKIRQALQYPLIVVATLLAAMSVMVAFVLPRFAQFFASLKIELPLQTRIVMFLGQLIGRYGWALAPIGAAAAAGWIAFLRTPRGRRWWDARVLRLPLLGALFEQMAMSRFAHALSALTSSGVPMLETLALVGESMNNTYIKECVDLARERVRAGEPLAGALKAAGVFPPIVLQMVATGQETGHVDELLRSVAEYYDQQSEYLLRRLLVAVEPAMLLLVGGGVLLMAMAVLVPMWDLVKVLKT